MKKSNLILLTTLAIIMVVILLGIVLVKIKYTAPSIKGEGKVSIRYIGTPLISNINLNSGASAMELN